MNEFLKTRNQVDLATQYLEKNNLVKSGLDCKNWEFYQVLPFLKDGNICDLGSSGGIVLPNAVKLNLKGLKVGIDLAYEQDYSEDGILYYRGDIMSTTMGNELFDIVTSLSVLEHQINFEKFAKECGRLLKKGGNLFVSFDYAPEKIDTSLTKLYSLDWNILCNDDIHNLIKVFLAEGLILNGEIDWAINDMVINPQYCSPAQGVSYTFSILEFYKN